MVLPIIVAAVAGGALLRRRRRHPAPAPPPASAQLLPGGLTYEQAVAVDENADAIAARVNAKAATLRKRAAWRLAVLVAAGVAAHRVHPLAALATTLLLIAIYLPFIRLLARSAANRRSVWSTIAAARAATRAARAASSLDAALTGTWTKDFTASDAMDPALDLLAVGGLPRRAIALVRGIDLKVDGDAFHMAAFSPIPLLKVREKYSLTGAPAVHRRRDLRGGGATGRTTRLPKGGGLKSVLTWNAPVAGECVDVYTVNGDMLTVTSTIKAAGGAVTYKTVYRRK